MPRPRKDIDPKQLVSAAGNGLSKTRAAEQLGISRSTLQRRMREKGSSWSQQKAQLTTSKGR